MSENESLKLESMRAGKRGRPQENEETEAIQGSMKERNGWGGGRRERSGFKRRDMTRAKRKD